MRCWLFIFWIINSLVSIVPIIISVAFFTLAERKLMAYLQRRVGPNVVGPYGLLQPIADALKLLFKESLFTKASTPYLYTIASTFPFIFGFINWFNIPILETSEISNLSSINFMYIFPISLGGLAGVVLAGWSSGSKYSTIGSFRGLSQLISYDIPMIFSVIPILLFSGSLDFIDIALLQLTNVWFIFAGIILFFTFAVTVLAETNRVPFDLPEAEAELVAGFNVEYSSINFALFFLGEYSSMLLLATVSVLLFISGQSFVNLNIFFSLGLFISIAYFISSYLDDIVEKLYLKIINFRFVSNLSNYTLFKINKLLVRISIYAGICSLMFYAYMPVFIIILNSSFLNEVLSYVGYLFIKMPFSSKVILLSFLFVLVRANLPRYRFDQLLSISWKTLIPISIGGLINSFFIMFSFNGFINLF